MATLHTNSMEPENVTVPSAQFAMLDMVIPGFSVFSSAVHAYLGIDLNLYIPLLLVICGTSWCWSYAYDNIRSWFQDYCMSSVRIKTDDEIFNMVMAWVANQSFSQRSRRFMANTNINSRNWLLWRLFEDEDDEEEDDAHRRPGVHKKNKQLRYTPSYGSHYFWFRGQPMIFERREARDTLMGPSSENDELEIWCFSWNPNLLKELLNVAREQHAAKDENMTPIYRGATGNPHEDQHWKRCMARSSRPFSTVILNDKVKKDLIDDISDYLEPSTRRWYAKRGIPYRRGYLLYGPPGTGKSSLSLALAGYFEMPIYILSLSSPMANEQNVSALFSSLPRRCVVLLEDIDSAGLTHARETISQDDSTGDASDATKKSVPVSSRLSLSGLLNILDGVASQEGRVLIMTTNHLEKLDKALIRPGRVDLTVEFGRADSGMTAAIFRAIYAPYEGEDLPPTTAEGVDEKPLDEGKDARAETIRKITQIAETFASKIPELEFSPAEIQGLLLRHKRNPLAAIEAAEDWIVQTRKEKAEKEVRDAEEKKEEEKKRKKAEEKKKRRKAKKKARRAKARSGNKDGESENSDSESDSSSSDESEHEKDQKDQGKGKDKAIPDSTYGSS